MKQLLATSLLRAAVGATGAVVFVAAAGGAFDEVADGVLSGEAAGDGFGCSVASAGDVNDDGFADLVIGALGNDFATTTAGRAYVYFGGPGATFDGDLAGAPAGASAGAQFGTSVAAAADVDGDGFADVIVGAPHQGAGSASVYRGGSGGTFDTISDRTLNGVTDGDQFGSSVD